MAGDPKTFIPKSQRPANRPADVATDNTIHIPRGYEYFESMNKLLGGTEVYLDTVHKIMNGIREGLPEEEIYQIAEGLDGVPADLKNFLTLAIGGMLSRRELVNGLKRGGKINHYIPQMLRTLGIDDNEIEYLEKNGQVKMDPDEFNSPFVVVFTMPPETFNIIGRGTYKGGYRTFDLGDGISIPVIILNTKYSDIQYTFLHEEIHAMYDCIGFDVKPIDVVDTELKKILNLNNTSNDKQDDKEGKQDKDEEDNNKDRRDKDKDKDKDKAIVAKYFRDVVIKQILDNKMRTELLARIIDLSITDDEEKIASVEEFYRRYVYEIASSVIGKLSKEVGTALNGLGITPEVFIDSVGVYYEQISEKWLIATNILLNEGYSEEDIVWLFMPFEVDQWPNVARRIARLNAPFKNTEYLYFRREKYIRDGGKSLIFTDGHIKPFTITSAELLSEDQEITISKSAKLLNPFKTADEWIEFIEYAVTNENLNFDYDEIKARLSDIVDDETETISWHLVWAIVGRMYVSQLGSFNKNQGIDENPSIDKNLVEVFKIFKRAQINEQTQAVNMRKLRRKQLNA